VSAPLVASTSGRPESGVSGRYVGGGVDGPTGDHLHRERLQHRHHLTVCAVAQRRLGAPVPAAQELLERVAEVLGAQSVDERISGRVAVAEPEEEIEEERRRTVTTERLGQVDYIGRLERLGQV